MSTAAPPLVPAQDRAPHPRATVSDVLPDASAPKRHAWQEWSRQASLVAAALALGACAGFLHGAAWLWPGWWQMAWLGQGMLIALALACTPRRAFLCGAAAGAVGIGLSFHWGYASLQTTIDAPPVFAALLFGSLVGVECIAFGLFALITSLAAHRAPRHLWLVPCAWVAIEYWYPRIFPWQLGYSQLENVPLLQIAEFVGSTGVSFVITSAAAAPALLALAFCSGNGPTMRKSLLRYACAGIALLAATYGFGIWRMRQWEAFASRQPTLKTALVQVDPSFVGSCEKLRARSFAIGEPVDLICWPESALGIYSESLEHFRDTDLTVRLSRDSFDTLEPAKDLRCDLLGGGRLFTAGAGEDGPFSMTAFLIDPAQNILGRYRKRTLLPFGEYVPGQSFYPEIRHWFTLREIIEAGQSADPLTTSGGQRLGVLICYEDMLPTNARRTVAAGSSALVSIIQGAAFHNPLTLVQHERLARMRAVENRRYFARCASTGVTCVISATGQMLAQAPLQSEQTLRAEIPMLSSRTLYNRLGDYFPWTCTALVAFGLARFCSRRAASAR